MKKNQDETKEVKRVTVALPQETIERLEKIAKRYNITMTDAIRRAIITESFIEEAVKEGSKILVQKPDKTICEVVFR